jgi:hypothetical protein
MPKLYEPTEALFQRGERVVVTTRRYPKFREYPVQARRGDAGTVLGARFGRKPMLISVLLDEPRGVKVLELPENLLAPEPGAV